MSTGSGWQCVVVADFDYAFAEIDALLKAYATDYRSAGVPDAARVYLGKSPAGERIYYFSPEACAIAVETLRKFSATPCLTLPNLSTLRLIRV